MAAQASSGNLAWNSDRQAGLAAVNGGGNMIEVQLGSGSMPGTIFASIASSESSNIAQLTSSRIITFSPAIQRIHTNMPSL